MEKNNIFKKVEILEKLQEDWEDVRGQMNYISIDFCGDFCKYLDDGGLLYDRFTEYADGNIDIYNSDLIEWARDNYNFIDDAIECLGAPEPFDFWQCIRQGQYYGYTEQLNSDGSNIIKGLALLYLIDELKNVDTIEKSEEDLKNLFDDIDLLNNNDTLQDIKDLCDEFLKNEQE